MLQILTWTSFTDRGLDTSSPLSCGHHLLLKSLSALSVARVLVMSDSVVSRKPITPLAIPSAAHARSVRTDPIDLAVGRMDLKVPGAQQVELPRHVLDLPKHGSAPARHPRGDVQAASNEATDEVGLHSPGPAAGNRMEVQTLNMHLKASLRVL